MDFEKIKHILLYESNDKILDFLKTIPIIEMHNYDEHAIFFDTQTFRVFLSPTYSAIFSTQNTLQFEIQFERCEFLKELLNNYKQSLVNESTTIEYNKAHSFKDLNIDLLDLQLACQNKFDASHLVNFLDLKEELNYIIIGQYKKIFDFQLVPIGFTIIEKLRKRVYHIVFFCAQKGYGKYLMQYVKSKLCRKGCILDLNSVKTAKEFYLKQHFVLAGADNLMVYKQLKGGWLTFFQI